MEKSKALGGKPGTWSTLPSFGTWHHRPGNLPRPCYNYPIRASVMKVAVSQFGVDPEPEHSEITRRLLGSSAIVSHNPDQRDISVALDVGGFVRRLLLFDTYILYSVRLKEIPELVRHFGFQGTMDLLSSGALEIRCECAQYAEGTLNTPPCPPLTFQFHVLEAHIWEQYLIDSLPALRNAPLSGRELMDLQGAVVKAVRRSDNRRMFSSEVAPAFEGELLSNERLVKAAVTLVLSKQNGMHELDDFTLKIHKVGDDRFQAETNLDSKLRLGSQDIHNTIKTALLGVAGLFQRMGEMKAHVAVAGFTEDELSLFRNKFESLVDALGSNRNEQRFLRVISIAGLSEDFVPNQRIDIEKILEIRNEPEAMEFRAWLADIDRLSDSEIRERVASLNAKLGLAVQTGTGKVLRLLVTTLAGILPPVGMAVSALDQFLWDRFFRRSGVAAFVNDLYPSIFGKRT
ncbi:MAG TPA: hypothetical protein VGR03_13890 [Candidatus Acidoferrum sp.]|nr:hypothetical protein [Candidatus Acidoferrum sp.]